MYILFRILWILSSEAVKVISQRELEIDRQRERQRELKKTRENQREIQKAKKSLKGYSEPVVGKGLLDNSVPPFQSQKQV